MGPIYLPLNPGVAFSLVLQGFGQGEAGQPPPGSLVSSWGKSVATTAVTGAAPHWSTRRRLSSDREDCRIGRAWDGMGIGRRR